MRTKRLVLIAASCVLLLGCSLWGEPEPEDTATLMANLYGTWVAKQTVGGEYTVVLLADRDAGAESSGLIGRIPGEASGKILIRDSADGRWLAGVYKVVGGRLLARSSTEETWALTFRCELRTGRLYMPTGDGRELELNRTAEVGLTGSAVPKAPDAKID